MNKLYCAWCGQPLRFNDLVNNYEGQVDWQEAREITTVALRAQDSVDLVTHPGQCGEALRAELWQLYARHDDRNLTTPTRRVPRLPKKVWDALLVVEAKA